MKNFLHLLRLSVAILITMQLNAEADCQALLVENFSYPAGSFLTANGWNAHSGEGTNPVKVHTGGLSFAGYLSSGIGLSAIMNNNGEDVNRSFTTQTSGAIYCAFLVNVNTVDSLYFLHLGATPMGTAYKARIFINGTGNSYQFGLSKYTDIPSFTSGSPYTTGITYLVILKYLFVTGPNNDEVSLFVISGTIPGTEPSVPSLGPTTGGDKQDLTNVTTVALRQNSVKQNIIIDGIRIATRWDEAVGALTSNYDQTEEPGPCIYPVPVTDKLNISGVAGIKEIGIFDILGRIVISLKPEPSDVTSIPVNELKSGVYILKLKTSYGIKVLRFIKT